jgi:hypothetical protein
MRAAPWVLALLLVASTVVSGCTGVFAAHVEPSVLENGWTEDEDQRDESKSFLGIGYQQATRVYTFDENRVNGPYPAQLVVVSIRILGGSSRSDLFERLDEAVQNVMEEEGIELDAASRREGDRTLSQGQDSVWFTYKGQAMGGATFFDQGRQIRILGEVFNDDRSSITVLHIGLAQITGSSILTGQENTSQWSKIVGDPSGTIEGYKRNDGLAHNVVAHG